MLMGERKNVSTADDSAAGTLQDGNSKQGAYYNAIRSQMEFYFSDANLYKDRYLKQLIDEDPLVPLETFLTFNKIKQMTNTVEDIAKALSSSELLELDESSSKVRRKTALPAVRNVDYRTIYVEELPTYADHDWVRSCFERFGPVEYVSVPRYPQSKRIKQFAFVEFARAGCLERVIRTYERLNNVLTAQANPAELCSIQAFIKERNESRKNAETNTKSVENADASAVVAGEECNQTKRRSHRRISNDVERSGVKYLRNESGDRVQISIDASSSEASEDDEDGDDDDNGDEEKNKDGVAENEEAENQENHQAKRKRRHRQLKPRNKIYELEPDQLQLRIASKLEWKRLRNKYLNTQRQAAAEFKRTSRQQRATENGAVLRDIKQSIAQQANGDVQQMKMNSYGETANGKTSSSLAAAAEKPSTDFERGLIVRVGLLEPCIYVKEFKADMRQYAAIKYVDIREGATQAFLRCESAPAAEEVIRKLNSAEMVCTLLVGEPEALYWRKIQEDRSAKLNKNEKVRCRRGREKLKQKIAEHVYFDDEEEHEHEDEHDAAEAAASVEET